MLKKSLRIGLAAMFALACLSVWAIQAATAQTAATATKPAEVKPLGHGKSFQTFMVKLRMGTKLEPGDEKKLAKFDMIMIARNWYDAINGDTWKAIHAVNPATEIFIQVEGPTIWRESETDPAVNRKDIGRLKDGQGHSMGSLEKDHPDFFLLKADGNRCLTYTGNFQDRFLMDFGNPGFEKYWIEAVMTDIVKQPWHGNGLHMDNTGPICTFSSQSPAKYDTREKWTQGMNSFVDAVTATMHKEGQKVWINAGGTQYRTNWPALLSLDELKNPPDVVGEEAAFVAAHARADSSFKGEADWRNQVDFLSKLRKCRQAYFSCCGMERDGKGKDYHGNPVTFWQTFWFALGSYMLGKDDELNNAYFFFFGKGGYSAKEWWFEEYEHADLGKALGKYQIKEIDRKTRVYWREFEKGYVYVNPCDADVPGIKLPRTCKAIGRDSAWKDPKGLPETDTIDMPARFGTILVKTK